MKTRPSYTLRLPDRIIELGSKTLIMGILNLTPDSFSDGGKFFNQALAIQRAHQMVEEGADLIDLGAESTRPGSCPVSPEEEIGRLSPVVKKLREELSVPISIDTYKAQVAEAMLDLGVQIINDISGLHFDPLLAKVIAKYQAAVVIMHIQGTPRNMQENPYYEDLILEITHYLAEGIKTAREAGLGDDQIMIDPGIGFGKTISHNLGIISQLAQFKSLNKPILVGPSRKSFLGKILDLPVTERLEGTAAAVAISITNGAHVVRVHDIKEMTRVSRVVDAIMLF